jgi:putative ABC transport system permease protein
MYRREWRQQVLVLGLLTVTVGAAVFAVVAAYAVAPSRDAEFGSADERVRIDVTTPGAAADALVASRDRFGTVDAVGHRAVAVAGAADPVDLRAQDPGGPYGAPMLDLTAGRYPGEPGEVALTDGVARLAGAAVGDTVELSGVGLTVVGLVENPGDLDDEFALAAPMPDDAPVAGASPEALTLLLRADDERLTGFPDPPGTTVGLVETRGDTERGTAGVVALSIGTLSLMLVSLVAAAGFVVVGQRRLRQLGMLAAVGATRRHLRLVTLTNGLAVGVVAATVGTAAALAGWLAVASALEEPAGHRIDRATIPWALVACSAALAVVCAGAAAWWPARSMARVPVVDALSARPAPPRPVRRSSALAAAFLAVGLACIAAGVSPADDEGSLLIVPGVILTVVAVLLLAPTTLRVLGAAARRAPVGVRLAWRDLARYQARSGAALAAAAVGLGIATTAVILAGTVRDQPDEGNLSDRQLLVRVDAGDVGDPRLYVPDVDPERLAQGQDAVDRLASTLGGATVVPLRTAVDPTLEPGPAGQPIRPSLILGRPVGPDVTRDAGTIYLATPELVDHLGLDADLASSPQPLLITAQAGPVHVTGNIARPDPASAPAGTAPTPILGAGRVPDDLVERVDIPPYGSLPHALLTPAALDAGGWTSAPSSWLVESPRALTGDHLDAARAVAADAGLTVEARRQQGGLSTLRTAATATGVLLALGILAMTVGLVRTEATRDIRTLTAVGAPGGTRRLITASTAGGLALLAVALATTVAYLAVGASYWPDTDRLTDTIPVAHLAAIVLGLPALATAAGWTLGGREGADLHSPAAD